MKKAPKTKQEIREESINVLILAGKIECAHELLIRHNFLSMPFGSGRHFFMIHDDSKNEVNIERYHVGEDGWVRRFRFTDTNYPEIKEQYLIDEFIKYIRHWKKENFKNLEY